MINKKTLILSCTIGSLLALTACIPTTSCVVEQKLQGDSTIAVIADKHTIGHWLVVGPFPTESSDTLLPDGTYDLGFSQDYLESIGGETNAILLPEMEIGNQQVQAVDIQGVGIVDLASIYHNLEYQVAYGFSRVYSPKAQTVKCLLGSDDAIKMWVNGKLVHKNYTFRATVAGDDRFDIKLQQGINTILVKVLNGTSGWGFVVELLTPEIWAERQLAEAEQNQYEAFMNAKIIPDWYNAWDDYFNPGDFPTLQWDKPYLAKQVIGDVPLEVRWFDADLNEVSEAINPGRYGYIAESTTAEGKVIRRAGTLYCWPWDWIGWSERPAATLTPLPAARFNKELYKQHGEDIANYIGRMVLLSTLNQEDGAALMAYLYELNQGKYADLDLSSPLLADDEYHIKLQKKVGGIKYSGQTLQKPNKIDGPPAKTLRPGTPAEAGFKPEIIHDLKTICNEWFEASGEPFITLVARNGIIVYEEATGEDASGKFTKSTVTPNASTTKLITGITFAQYMHQGLIGLDDPVGKYYPDFPLTGEKALTLRHCFTHTSGLVGHTRWGGVHNPRLENVIANQLEYLPVGTKSTYNGDGYNLAGRVMEAVSGKSIFRVIHENLISPLELKSSSIEEDLAFSLISTAGDLAVVGQLLLNRGSYGQYEYFSPEVFNKILPKNLAQYYPGMDWDQGIGITWMRTRHPDAGKNGNAQDLTILSPNTIGHGSATSAVLQVDLDNGLVVTQTRRQGGSHYNKYLSKLLMAINQNLK